MNLKTKRAAIAKAFGDVPVEPENIDFLYRGRDLAKIPARGRQELAYFVEFDNVGQVIEEMLGRIRQRYGAVSFAKVAERSIGRIAFDPEIGQGRWSALQSIIAGAE
jgi:hypothetical protein